MKKFSRKKKIIKKSMCAYLKFSDPLPQTHLYFFIWPKGEWRALVSLHICPDLPDPFLLTDAIDTNILCTGPCG